MTAYAWLPMHVVFPIQTKIKLADLNVVNQTCCTPEVDVASL